MALTPIHRRAATGLAATLVAAVPFPAAPAGAVIPDDDGTTFYTPFLS